VWFPAAAISWNSVSEDLKALSYTNHEHKYGMGAADSVFDKYLVSFYWVVITITSNWHVYCL
jgi:hypothetical protein